jgi:hypothetical protein
MRCVTFTDVHIEKIDNSVVPDGKASVVGEISKKESPRWINEIFEEVR